MGDIRDPDEFFDVAEKILEKLNAVFEKDNSLDEFDIVPVEIQSNRSPVIHVNHKLALESWCVPFLYSHSFKCFTELLPKRNYLGLRKSDPTLSTTTARTSSSASSSSSSVCMGHKSQHYHNGQLTEEDRSQRRLELTRLLVLLNPDLALAWNFRRKAYLRGLTRFQDEINLIALVLSRKPKNFECFSYRKWLVKQVITSQPITIEIWWPIFLKEIKVIEASTSAYFSNYHAWDYRRWLLETSLDSSFSSPEMKQQALSSEKTLSDEWMEKHVSDHSGVHYRQYLLVRLSDKESSSNGESPDGFSTFKKELENNLSFISLYPGHETLWYHRRFLLQFAVSRLQCRVNENHNHRMEVDDESDSSTSPVVGSWEEELKELKLKEQYLVRSVLSSSLSREGEDDVDVNFITKDTIQLNVLYAHRHSKWLSLIFKWNLLDNNNPS